MLLSLLFLSPPPSMPPKFVATMKYSAIFILLLVCLHCEANNNKTVCEVLASVDSPAGVNGIQLEFYNCGIDEVLNTTKHYPNTRVLDISNAQFETLDWLTVSLDNLERFNASHNRIKNLTNLLETAPNVIEIDLSFNQIQKISTDAFGSLNRLINLDLSNNLIEQINSKVFSKIGTNLEHINLSNNHLVGLPDFPSDICRTLIEIRLEGNTIKNFTCQRLPWRESLSAVYLSWTYVERFDGAEQCDGKRFRVIWDGDDEGILRTTNGTTIAYELHCNQQSFQNLRSFAGHNNAFINIIDLIASFDSVLTELDVSNNLIGKWDQAELQKFTNLRKLALSGTRLTQFNLREIENARNLRSLDISSNGLDHLESLSTLKSFDQLKELNVSGNRLPSNARAQILNYITPTIEVLDLSDSEVGKLYYGTFERFSNSGQFNSTLRNLHLRNTHLEFADDRDPFEQLTHLHELDISGNNLSSVDFRTLSGTLIKLHSFSCSNCELKMPLNIVRYLGNALKKLNLSGNRIGGGGVGSAVFQTLTNLIHLNFSATHLEKFDFKSVHHQEFLYTLDISHNYLSAIDLHDLPHFKHLKRLYLNDNELTKLINFKSNASLNVSFAIARNQLPCMYLKQLRYDSPNLKYIGNQLDQKHGDDCRSSMQAIGDFLDSVYDTIKFW